MAWKRTKWDEIISGGGTALNLPGGLSPAQDDPTSYWNSIISGSGGIGETQRTNNLQGQLDRGRAQLGARGIEPPQETPGVLSRIFDVLSRGQYAMAEGTLSGSEAVDAGANPLQALGEFGKGFGRGLTGRAKTSFSDVLEQKGMDPGWQRTVAGFIGDVALDPTTYIGTGLVKKAGKEAVEQAGIRTAKNVVTDLQKNPAPLRALTSGRLMAGAKARKGRAVSNAQVKAAEKSILDEIVDSAADNAMRAANKPGKFQVKFAGKDIMPQKLGENIYNSSAYFYEPLKNTPFMQWMRKSFKTDEFTPGQLGLIQRMYAGKTVENFDDYAQQWRGLLKGTTKEERARVAHAIEQGIDLSHDPKLGPIQDWANKMNKAMFMRESEVLGVLGKDEFNPNYVYHVYKNKKSPKLNKFQQARKFKTLENPSFAQERIIPTLQDALKEGLDPIEDIGDIMVRRMLKHQRTAMHKEMMDRYVKEFGIKDPPKQLIKRMGLEKSSSEFAKDVYFPPQVTKALDFLDSAYQREGAADEILKLYDKGLRWWKTYATVVNPGHHFRNFIGDVYLNALDGVGAPSYRTAAKMMLHRQSGAAVDMVGGQVKQLKNVPTTSIGKAKVPLGRLYDIYNDVGLKSGFVDAEIGRAAKKNVVMDFIRGFSEGREDFGRLAHFVHAMKRHGKKLGPDASYDDLKKVAENAFEDVSKFNFNYGDLTEFERRFAKKWIPFYTFWKKNAELHLQMLATHPGRLAVVPKGQRALEELLGTDEKSDPQFEDTIPQWLRDSGALRIAGGMNPLFMDLNLPISDLASFETRNGGKEFLGDLLNRLTPLAKIPYEVVSGRELFTGAPRESGFVYGAQQIPGARIIAQLLGADSVDEQQLPLNVLNYLTGAGVQRVTENRKRGELRRQQDPVETLLREDRQRARDAFWGP